LVDAPVTLILVRLMALTSAASEGGMGDTTSMAIISLRVISMEAGSMVVDSTVGDFMAVAATGRWEEE
jgi:general stress protein CsbA